jgi:hypothetical protein
MKIVCSVLAIYFLNWSSQACQAPSYKLDVSSYTLNAILGGAFANNNSIPYSGIDNAIAINSCFQSLVVPFDKKCDQTESIVFEGCLI